MLTIYAEYFERLQTLHGAVANAIGDLPQPALDWTPAAEINSLAVLVTHLSGAERYWIGDVAGLDSSQRRRSSEFETRGVEAQSLTSRLDETLAHSRGVLERLSLASLEEERVSPMDGRRVSVAWALAHALEHTALHVGHIELVRQLWDLHAAGRLPVAGSG